MLAPATGVVIPVAGRLRCPFPWRAMIAGWTTAAGRPVTVQDLSAGAVGGGRAIGVQDQAPAPPVDAHVVVKLAN